MRAIVDLPEPLSPARPNTSPGSSRKLTSLTASPRRAAAEQPAADGEGLRDADDVDQGLAHAVASRRQQAADCPGATSK